MLLVHCMLIIDYPYEDSAKVVCWCPWNNGHDHQMRSIAVQGWIPICEYGKSCDVLENQEQMVTNTIKYVQKGFKILPAANPNLCNLFEWADCDIQSRLCLLHVTTTAFIRMEIMWWCSARTLPRIYTNWCEQMQQCNSLPQLWMRIRQWLWRVTRCPDFISNTKKPVGNETLEMPSSVARHLWCYGLLKLFMHYFLQENLSWKADKFLGQWKTTATSPQQVAFKKGQAVNMVMATANRSS